LPLFVFLSAIALLSTVQLIDKIIAPPYGAYFQLNSSDAIPHTLPIAHLRTTPLESLWYLHKFPPLFDGLRAFIAQWFPCASAENLSVYVDQVLYVVWAIFFAGMATLIFVWLRRLSSPVFAFAATFVWILHPAPIFFARFLDTTLMSSFGVFWFFYELWRLARGEGSVRRLAFASVFLFYVRTVFQWYFFPLMLVVLVMMKVPRRHIMRFILISGICVAPYLIKQYAVFGTISSSTFDGYHKCGIIWYYPSNRELVHLYQQAPVRYPSDADYYSAGDAENSRRQHADSILYGKIFMRQLIAEPGESFSQIMKSLKMNARDYWRPTADFGRGAIVRFLFWIKPYNKIFSGASYIILLLVSALMWYVYSVKQHALRWRSIIASALPFTYIILITHLCNRYEWTEALRMKFLLEPLYFLFIAGAVYKGYYLLRRGFFKG